jgi:ribosomal protein S18 acetylase RimI-like enzyme
VSGPTASRVESIERAIVAAVAPPEVEELDGWIIAYDSGTVSRARSAAPLRHTGVDAQLVPVIIHGYARRDIAPMFRIPESPRLRNVEAALTRAGLRPEQPTQVQVAPAANLASAEYGDVQLDAEPDGSWASVFLGPGFDPVDGASRVHTFRRARNSVYASIREGDVTIAAGVLALGHGWASIHGMRTAQTHRRRALASRILASLARRAVDAGYGEVMLQVERNNVPAQALYARHGFSTAWTYLYWRS